MRETRQGLGKGFWLLVASGVVALCAYGYLFDRWSGYVLAAVVIAAALVANKKPSPPSK